MYITFSVKQFQEILRFLTSIFFSGFSNIYPKALLNNSDSYNMLNHGNVYYYTKIIVVREKHIYPELLSLTGFFCLLFVCLFKITLDYCLLTSRNRARRIKQPKQRLFSYNHSILLSFHHLWVDSYMATLYCSLYIYLIYVLW